MSGDAHKVVDAPGYVRDPKSGAVILNDHSNTNKYQMEKQRRIEEIRKMKALENEVAHLRNEMEEIKRLLLNNNK